MENKSIKDTLMEKLHWQYKNETDLVDSMSESDPSLDFFKGRQKGFEMAMLLVNGLLNQYEQEKKATNDKEVRIDWNFASTLGLIERINSELLHPLGLAMCRDVSTGVSPYLLVAEDKVWTYSPDFKPLPVLRSEEIHQIIELNVNQQNEVQ